LPSTKEKNKRIEVATFYFSQDDWSTSWQYSMGVDTTIVILDKGLEIGIQT